jgi:anti-sigma factor ChrR (cupin superfamily)
MTWMDDQTIEGLAALDAAGALGADESARLRDALSRASEPLRVRVAGLYEAAVMAACATAPAATPSPALRARVLSQVAAIESPPARQFAFVLGEGGGWQSMGVPGTFYRPLAQSAAYAVVLVKGEPGARFPPHHHGGAEECYIVAGDLFSQGRRFFAGDFLHADAGSEHDETSTEGGCLLVIVAAHPAGQDGPRPGEVHV